jgi:hypothetical protein
VDKCHSTNKRNTTTPTSSSFGSDVLFALSFEVGSNQEATMLGLRNVTDFD